MKIVTKAQQKEIDRVIENKMKFLARMVWFTAFPNSDMNAFPVEKIKTMVEDIILADDCMPRY